MKGGTTCQEHGQTTRGSALNISNCLPLPLQAKLHLDYKVKVMAESILHNFVPAAIKAIATTADETEEKETIHLDADQSTAVGAAAVSAAILLNAPHSFLQFLLCLPWPQFTDVYAKNAEIGYSAAAAALKLRSNAPATAAAKTALVNYKLNNERLLDCIMDFLYTENVHHHSTVLPPLMCLPKNEQYIVQNGIEAGSFQRAVLVHLQGCSPLHCAALRGNPDLVDVLLAAKADALVKNALGQLPMELVPRCSRSVGRCAHCGQNHSGCLCLNSNSSSHHQQQLKNQQQQQVEEEEDGGEPLECLSGMTRLKLVLRAVASWPTSLFAWMYICMLCLLCSCGFFGKLTTLLRPDVEVRGQMLWEERRKKAQHRAQALVLKLRTEVLKGKEELMRASSSSTSNETDDSNNNNYNKNNVESCAVYPHFKAAITILRSIRQRQQQLLQTPCTTAPTTPTTARTTDGKFSYSLIPEAHFLPRTDWPEIEIQREEMASIWACYAVSALDLVEKCVYCSGSAINSAVEEITGLLLAKNTHTHSDSGFGGSSRVVYIYLAAALRAKGKFLLQTDVQKSPTRVSIQRAQECIAEWSRIPYFDGLCSGGNNGGDGGGGESKIIDEVVPLEIQCLESWATSAAADIVLVEFLLGTSLPVTQSLSEAVQSAVQYDASTGRPCLGRTVTKQHLVKIENALQQAKKHASDHIVAIVEGIVAAAAEEISAADKLRELFSHQVQRTCTTEEIRAVLDAASKYPSLKDEVEQFKAMRERWAQREEAQRQLDAAGNAARSPPPSGILIITNTGTNNSISLNEEVFWKELSSRIQVVEAAIEAARQSSISVARVKKILSDLQAQGAAVEAGKALEEVLLDTTRAGFSAALKACLNKAESTATAAAVGAAAGAGAEGFLVGSQWLAPRLTAARSKLNLIRAAETLARAVISCSSVSDLPKLEAAILAAKKIGAEDLDADVYNRAKELRNRLATAATAKTSLENAVKVLQKASQTSKTAESAVKEAEKAIVIAKEQENLLETEICSAQEAISAVHAAFSAEAKLTKALHEGASVAVLSLAIKEAAGAIGGGLAVQVNEARKILKLLQNLETAISTAKITTSPSSPLSSTDPSGKIHALQAKIAAAVAGGVSTSHALIIEARSTLHKLRIADLRAELDAALKSTATTPTTSTTKTTSTKGKNNNLKKAFDSTLRQSPGQRLAILRAVLEKVDDVLYLEENGDLVSTTCLPAPPARTISNASNSTDGGGDGGGDVGGAKTPPLTHEPSVFGKILHTQSSNVSQEASSTSSVSTPRWSNLSLSNTTSGGGGRDLSYLGRNCSAIELRVFVVSDIAAVWFEPKSEANFLIKEEGYGDDDEDVSSTSMSSDNSDSAFSNTDDDIVAVRRMAKEARQRLHQEEVEQARFEREKIEEARLNRQLQLREKSAREAIEKERAEKARAERAERLAAVEAQKAERRERERMARAERELERQVREAAAKEHFVLLQRRRQMLADQARAAHMAQLLAEQQAQQTAGLFSPPTSPAQPLLPPVTTLASDFAEKIHHTSSLPALSSHTTLWTSTDSHESGLLSTKINASALLPLAPTLVGSNSTSSATTTTTTSSSLFGDLGGASWLSTNPLTSNSTIPIRTTSLDTRTASPSTMLWGSADSTIGDAGALAATIACDRTSGLWSSISSDGVASGGGGGGEMTTSILGLYPPYPPAQNATLYSRPYTVPNTSTATSPGTQPGETTSLFADFLS